MSDEVELRDLQAALARYGAAAFLVTVGDTGTPHVVSVPVTLEGGTLVAPAGRTTAANVAARSSVSLLWPGPVEDYCLIVDGPAEVAGRGDAARVIVEPVRAVRHRLAGGDPARPSCITLLDRRDG